MNKTDVKAYNPSGEDMEFSQAVTPPAPADMQNSSANSTSATVTTPASNTTASNAKTSTTSHLPQTASPLGWVMLSSLLALAGALGVRLARQSIGS